MKSLRHAVTTLVAVFFTLSAAISFLVLHVARRVVTPGRRVPDTEILVVDTASQTIELTRTADTELPGRYGLFTTGSHGYLKLGAVLSTGARSVRRKLLTHVETGATVDRLASFSGWYYTVPSELHLPWENIQIDSPAGACPAWLFPAPSSTWVIHVHGRGATRSEGLRAVPTFHAQGLPIMLVSYRNDGEGPRTRSGAYALGSSEWHDVDAAIAYALQRGAQRVILMGWSMGGAIVLQAAVSSAHREAIEGIVLDSPVIDWRNVLRFQAREERVRGPLPELAMSALSLKLTARLSGAEGAISFDSLDMVARADELSVPILLLHSEDDGFVPADASHALAEARPDIVTMPQVTGARHTKLWNHDEAAWTRSITQWLGAHGFVASSGS